MEDVLHVGRGQVGSPVSLGFESAVSQHKEANAPKNLSYLRFRSALVVEDIDGQVELGEGRVLHDSLVDLLLFFLVD